MTAAIRATFSERLELQRYEVVLDLSGRSVCVGEVGRVVDYGTGQYPMVEFADRVERISRSHLTIVEGRAS